MSRVSAWVRRTLAREHPEAAALGDALAYEVVSVLWSGSIVAMLAWSALGGRADDVYAWIGMGDAPDASNTAILAIGPESMALWGIGDSEGADTPHDLVAELVDFARLAGARTVAVDLLLDRPSEAAGADARLAEAVGAFGRVVTATRYVGSETGGPPFAVAPLPAIQDQVLPGFANLVSERARLLDGPDAPTIVRYTYLQQKVALTQVGGSWRENAMNANGKDDASVPMMPSFALAAAWLHRADTRSVPAAAETLRRALVACQGSRASCGGMGLPALEPGDLGDAFPIPYRGRAGRDGIPTVDGAVALQLMAVLREAGTEDAWTLVGESSREARALAGRLVVIGRVDPAGDRHITPSSPPLVGVADTHGVRIQAQMMEALLSGRRLRTLDGGWPEWVAAAVAVLMVWKARIYMSAVAQAAVVLFGSTGILAVGVLMYRYAHVSLPLGVPVGAAVATWSMLRLHAWLATQTGQKRG